MNAFGEVSSTQLRHTFNSSVLEFTLRAGRIYVRLAAASRVTEGLLIDGQPLRLGMPTEVNERSLIHIPGDVRPGILNFEPKCRQGKTCFEFYWQP
jgi:hypothetical protein